MIWRVGMKAVCILDARKIYESAYGPCPHAFPEKGRVYTIKRIEEGRGLIRKGILFFELEEIRQIPTHDSRAFRPVASTKTDISIFHRMLNPSRIEEQVS